MSDMSRAFNPWEEGFTKGLYLAGVEVENNSIAPEGWTKWIIPAYEYVYVKVENGTENTFPAVLEYLKDNNLKLAGAVHDFICPQENRQPYMFFPIRKINWGEDDCRNPEARSNQLNIHKWASLIWKPLKRSYGKLNFQRTIAPFNFILNIPQAFLFVETQDK